MRRLILLLALGLAGPAAAAPERIVALGGGVTATVQALGAPVVAIDASSVRGRPTVPVVGYYRQLSAEGVLALKPDLVIGPDATGPETAVSQLRAAGVEVVLMPEVITVDGAIERIRTIGAVVGRPAEAAKIADDVAASLAEARALRPEGVVAPRVLFVFVHGGASLQVAGRETAAEAMITAAGGQNAVDGYAGYRPLTAEAVVLARPDVVLATPRSLAAVGGEAGLWKTPGIAATPAGQAKRLVVMDDLDLLGFGPATGTAVVALTRALFAEK
ncbi:MAG: ABC transporter substrate-binding protein [Myxococcales bacterium]|nr:ABC transporter substrate-binding protein [Myxococcales bacterium]MCB9550461.1 ABC transporter substrate-binding protein [Myxococcales bacterium]